MSDRALLVIVLAAGLGTRMKSQTPKVLHKIAGRTMLEHVLHSASESVAANAKVPAKFCVVTAPNANDTEVAARRVYPAVKIFTQEERLGTAHAVLAAREAIAGFSGDVMVLYGDTPLIEPATLSRLRDELEKGYFLAVLGFHSSNPTGYGRLITNSQGELLEIVEEKEATAEQRAITLCNSGVFCFRSERLLEVLDQIGNDNAKGEYYLTDAVKIAREKALSATVVECDEQEVLGVNSRQELAVAEQIMQTRLRQKAMAGGVTLLSPETVYLSADTQIGRDVLIEPNVIIGPGVKIGDNVIIRGFSHLENAVLHDDVQIGPFARLRPGTELRQGVKVGNFVEIKNAEVCEGAKISHLSYIGDAHVGAEANIGAGTITCNYDGFNKHPTEIGAGAFIGSNSALVAPVTIGEGAYIGSGSVITKDVPPAALSLTRTPQIDRPGWADKFRAIHKAGHDRKKA